MIISKITVPEDVEIYTTSDRLTVEQIEGGFRYVYKARSGSVWSYAFKHMPTDQDQLPGERSLHIWNKIF
jgi:hypothetical protein